MGEISVWVSINEYWLCSIIKMSCLTMYLGLKYKTKMAQEVGRKVNVINML